MPSNDARSQGVIGIMKGEGTDSGRSNTISRDDGEQDSCPRVATAVGGRTEKQEMEKGTTEGKVTRKINARDWGINHHGGRR